MESYCICECTVQLKIIVLFHSIQSVVILWLRGSGHIREGVVTSERAWSHQRGRGHIREGVVTSKREWSHQRGSGHIKMGVVTSEREWSHQRGSGHMKMGVVTLEEWESASCQGGPIAKQS